MYTETRDYDVNREAIEALKRWIEERIADSESSENRARALHENAVKHVNQGRIDAFEEMLEILDAAEEDGWRLWV